MIRVTVGVIHKPFQTQYCGHDMAQRICNGISVNIMEYRNGIEWNSFGPDKEIMVLMANAKSHPSKRHVQLPSRARNLIFGPRLHKFPYFEYAYSQSFDKVVMMCMFV